MTSIQSLLRFEPGCFSLFVCGGREAEMRTATRVCVCGFVQHPAKLFPVVLGMQLINQFQIPLGTCTEAAALPSLGQVKHLFLNDNSTGICKKQYHAFTSGSTANRGYLEFHGGTDLPLDRECERWEEYLCEILHSCLYGD